MKNNLMEWCETLNCLVNFFGMYSRFDVDANRSNQINTNR